MNSKSLKSSGTRRLGLHPAAASPLNDVYNQQQPHQQATIPQQPQQPRLAARPPTVHQARGPGSKAQALSAFRSLVAGSSHTRSNTAWAQEPSTDPATLQQQDAAGAPAGAAAGLSVSAQLSAGTNQQRGNPTTALVPPSRNNQPPSNPTSAAPAPPLRIPSIPPCQLVPKVTKALEKLQAQLSSRTLTYLYQFDGLLSTAASALTGLTTFLLALHASTHTSTDPAEGKGLQQLLQDSKGAEGDARAGMAAVLDLLLQLCMQTWEVEMLLLQHHHIAEPQNTARQAGQFHQHARGIWEAWEAHSLSCEEPAAATAGHGGQLLHSVDPAEATGSAAGPEGNWPLTEGLCAALAVMAEVASAWGPVQHADEPDWCYQQLRKHLCSIAAAGANEGLRVETRRALQRLQFSTLTGNLSLAARQGHRAMWANLTSLVQQLLQQTVLEDEEALGASLTMAGALADTASTMLQANRPGATADADSISKQSASGKQAALPAQNTSKAAGVCESAASIAVLLLEFAVELLDNAKQRTAAMGPQQQQKQGQDPSTGPSPLTQQVADIQQQVLMQLAQAYLSCSQPKRVLDCISIMQGLSTGRTPPAGLLQLSSLALLQQGKLDAASAQLCAWLKQGGQSTAEACGAVRSFLLALHSCGVGSAAANVQERAAAVQAVAAAAGELCRSDPAVALEVVMQLLAEEGSGSAQLSLEDLAVQLLSLEEVSQLLRQRPEDCKKCHMMLHEKGAAHYTSNRHTSATHLLTPAVFFATSLTAGKSARLLAMALLKSGQPRMALQYVGLAEQQEGFVSATGCIIRLQAAFQVLKQDSKPQPSSTAAAAVNVAAKQAAAQDDGQAGLSEAQGLVMSAVRSLASVQDVPSDAWQAAFSLCMQHSNTSAAWQVLLSWRDSCTAAAPAPPPSAAAAAGIRGQQVLLQVLSLMQHVAMTGPHGVKAADAGAVSTSNDGFANDASSWQRLPQQQLVGMCDTITQCLPAMAGSAKEVSVSSSAFGCRGSGYTIQQQMWLVETGLKLGVAAAQQGLFEKSCAVLQGTVTACNTLRSGCMSGSVGGTAAAAATAEAGAAVPAQQQQGKDTACASVLGPLAAAALCSRTAAALCVAASILLQGGSKSLTASTAGGKSALQQAGELLTAAQQQLQAHALQQLDSSQQQTLLRGPNGTRAACNATDPGSIPPAAAGGPGLLAWADPAAVSAEMQALQLLLLRLSFAVAQRLGQDQQMKQLLQLLVQHPLVTASDLKAAAMECLQPGRPGKGQAVAALCYSHMLRLAAATEPPQLAAVAEAVAGMLTLVTSHAVKIKAVSKVVEVLGACAEPLAANSAGKLHTGPGNTQDQNVPSLDPSPAGAAGKAGSMVGAVPVSPVAAYPAKSLQWLLATCWNAAVQTSSSSDSDTARQYMELVQALATTQYHQQQHQQQDRPWQQEAEGMSRDTSQKAAPSHWLLGSRHYKQLCARLLEAETHTQGTPSASVALSNSQADSVACHEVADSSQQALQLQDESAQQQPQPQCVGTQQQQQGGYCESQQQSQQQSQGVSTQEQQQSQQQSQQQLQSKAQGSQEQQQGEDAVSQQQQQAPQEQQLSAVNAEDSNLAGHCADMATDKADIDKPTGQQPSQQQQQPTTADVSQAQHSSAVQIVDAETGTGTAAHVDKHNLQKQQEPQQQGQEVAAQTQCVSQSDAVCLLQPHAPGELQQSQPQVPSLSLEAAAAVTQNPHLVSQEPMQAEQGLAAAAAVVHAKHVQAAASPAVADASQPHAVSTIPAAKGANSDAFIPTAAAAAVDAVAMDKDESGHAASADRAEVTQSACKRSKHSGVLQPRHEEPQGASAPASAINDRVSDLDAAARAAAPVVHHKGSQGARQSQPTSQRPPVGVAEPSCSLAAAEMPSLAPAEAPSSSHAVAAAALERSIIVADPAKLPASQPAAATQRTAAAADSTAAAAAAAPGGFNTAADAAKLPRSQPAAAPCAAATTDSRAAAAVLAHAATTVAALTQESLSSSSQRGCTQIGTNADHDASFAGALQASGQLDTELADAAVGSADAGRALDDLEQAAAATSPAAGAAASHSLSCPGNKVVTVADGPAVGMVADPAAAEHAATTDVDMQDASTAVADEPVPGSKGVVLADRPALGMVADPAAAELAAAADVDMLHDVAAAADAPVAAGVEMLDAPAAAAAAETADVEMLASAASAGIADIAVVADAVAADVAGVAATHEGIQDGTAAATAAEDTAPFDSMPGAVATPGQHACIDTAAAPAAAAASSQGNKLPLGQQHRSTSGAAAAEAAAASQASISQQDAPSCSSQQHSQLTSQGPQQPYSVADTVSDEEMSDVVAATPESVAGDSLAELPDDPAAAAAALPAATPESVVASNLADLPDDPAAASPAPAAAQAAAAGVVAMMPVSVARGSLADLPDDPSAAAAAAAASPAAAPAAAAAAAGMAEVPVSSQRSMGWKPSSSFVAGAEGVAADTDMEPLLDAVPATAAMAAAAAQPAAQAAAAAVMAKMPVSSQSGSQQSKGGKQASDCEAGAEGGAADTDMEPLLGAVPAAAAAAAGPAAVDLMRQPCNETAAVGSEGAEGVMCVETSAAAEGANTPGAAERQLPVGSLVGQGVGCVEAAPAAAAAVAEGAAATAAAEPQPRLTTIVSSHPEAPPTTVVSTQPEESAFGEQTVSASAVSAAAAAPDLLQSAQELSQHAAAVGPGPQASFCTQQQPLDTEQQQPMDMWATQLDFCMTGADAVAAAAHCSASKQLASLGDALGLVASAGVDGSTVVAQKAVAQAWEDVGDDSAGQRSAQQQLGSAGAGDVHCDDGTFAAREPDRQVVAAQPQQQEQCVLQQQWMTQCSDSMGSGGPHLSLALSDDD